jgi:DNA-binding transcriptional ArsR family regulator
MSDLIAVNTLAEVAAAIGDAARANILVALMDGRALTAGELAWAARVGASTTSGHLSRLLGSGLILAEKQGRHRYFRLASPAVAEVLENLMGLAAAAPRRHVPAGPTQVSLRRARTCYDHLAGEVGVGLTAVLQARGWLRLEEPAITPDGQRFLAAFGVAPPDPRQSRPVCRTCLDWSERRLHLAGQTGAHLCRRLFDLGWLERQRDSRALTITPVGEAGLRDVFGLEVSA